MRLSCEGVYVSLNELRISPFFLETRVVRDTETFPTTFHLFGVLFE